MATNMILEDLNTHVHSPSCCSVAEFPHLDCNILMFPRTCEAQLWILLFPTLHSDHMVVSLELPDLSIHWGKKSLDLM